jgi:hypothetical protein
MLLEVSATLDAGVFAVSWSANRWFDCAASDKASAALTFRAVALRR